MRALCDMGCEQSGQVSRSIGIPLFPVVVFSGASQTDSNDSMKSRLRSPATVPVPDSTLPALLSVGFCPPGLPKGREPQKEQTMRRNAKSALIVWQHGKYGGHVADRADEPGGQTGMEAPSIGPPILGDVSVPWSKTLFHGVKPFYGPNSG